MSSEDDSGISEMLKLANDSQMRYLWRDWAQQLQKEEAAMVQRRRPFTNMFLGSNTPAACIQSVVMDPCKTEDEKRDFVWLMKGCLISDSEPIQDCVDRCVVGEKSLTQTQRTASSGGPDLVDNLATRICALGEFMKKVQTPYQKQTRLADVMQSPVHPPVSSDTDSTVIESLAKSVSSATSNLKRQAVTFDIESPKGKEGNSVTASLKLMGSLKSTESRSQLSEGSRNSNINAPLPMPITADALQSGDADHATPGEPGALTSYLQWASFHASRTHEQHLRFNRVLGGYISKRNQDEQIRSEIAAERVTLGKLSTEVGQTAEHFGAIVQQCTEDIDVFHLEREQECQRLQGEMEEAEGSIKLLDIEEAALRKRMNEISHKKKKMRTKIGDWKKEKEQLQRRDAPEEMVEALTTARSSKERFEADSRCCKMTMKFVAGLESAASSCSASRLQRHEDCLKKSITQTCESTHQMLRRLQAAISDLARGRKMIAEHHKVEENASTKSFLSKTAGRIQQTVVEQTEDAEWYVDRLEDIADSWASERRPPEEEENEVRKLVFLCDYQYKLMLEELKTFDDDLNASMGEGTPSRQRSSTPPQSRESSFNAAVASKKSCGMPSKLRKRAICKGKGISRVGSDTALEDTSMGCPDDLAEELKVFIETYNAISGGRADDTRASPSANAASVPADLSGVQGDSMCSDAFSAAPTM